MDEKVILNRMLISITLQVVAAQGGVRLVDCYLEEDIRAQDAQWEVSRRSKAQLLKLSAGKALHKRHIIPVRC